MTKKKLSKHDYGIGWICALSIELAAAKLMLDEEHEDLDDQDGADTNIYTLGRIMEHNVAIACLPSGQYGTISAAVVAQNMMRTFPDSLRIGLMIGVGGGIPSPNHDARLGDIVVSHPSGTCGGVVQYDMGKIQSDGRLIRSGALNSPPATLLNAVSKMKAEALLDTLRFQSFLKSSIDKTASTKRTFGRPDPSTDRLFRAEIEHPPDQPSCSKCDRSAEIYREQRENDVMPQTNYGIIASGTTVMKDGKTRDRLQREINASCFEMGAAGLM